jgi:hypothetical protein
MPPGSGILKAYWAEIAKGIEWIKPPEKIFDAEAGIYGRWFVGAELQHLPTTASTGMSPPEAASRRR